MQKELEQLGFTPHEATIYLALVDSGLTGAGEIIKKTGLHRNVVYENLEKLIARKLVFKVIRNKIAQFQLTDPHRIVDQIETNLSLAKSLIPGIIEKSEVTQDIVIYDGIEGFRNYSFSALNKIPEGGVLYVLGSIGDRWYELMGDQYQRYEKQRIKKQIIWKMIAFEKSERDQELIKSDKLCQVKIISKNYQTPANANIWQDTVALQTLVEPYSVIEIRNKALVQSYLNYFNLLWNIKK